MTTYTDRVAELEAEGLTTSDAQSVAEAEGFEAEACPFSGTTVGECSTIRERSVAGTTSNDVPSCPVHGEFTEQENDR